MLIFSWKVWNTFTGKMFVSVIDLLLIYPVMIDLWISGGLNKFRIRKEEYLSIFDESYNFIKLIPVSRQFCERKNNHCVVITMSPTFIKLILFVFSLVFFIVPYLVKTRHKSVADRIISCCDRADCDFCIALWRSFWKRSKSSH